MTFIQRSLESLTQKFIDPRVGWQVVRGNQPTIQAIQNNTIYFDVISKRRLGVQSVKPIYTRGRWYTGTKWYEEWLIQVSAFRQRTPDDDWNNPTDTSVDAITKLQMFVNNPESSLTAFDYQYNTVRPFSEPWMNLIRSTDLREIDFETDSGLKEKMPQFDFTLVIEQGYIHELPSVDNVELQVTPV